MKPYVLAILLCAFLPACKENESGRGEATNTATKAVDASSPTAGKDDEVEMLVEQLVSPNRPVNPEGRPFSIPLPSDYDTDAQRNVELAVERLKNLGKRAFPALIASWKDDRYCRTNPTSIERDFTVGETCLKILGGQIERFENRFGYKGMPSYSFSVINADPDQWWREHSEMSIEAMRLEALNWTIEEERKHMEEQDEQFFKFMGTSRSDWAKECIEPLERLLAEHQKLQAEQDGAEQPATALESKSEGKEKPKPESEERSQ